MKKVSLLLVGLLLMQVSNAQNLKSTDWNSDLDYLAKELPLKHHNLFMVKSKGDYQTGLNRIKSIGKNLSDLDVALKLQQLIAGFGDSHTKINYAQFIDKNQILPLHLYWFSDGLFVLHTTPEYAEILGQQIVSINGVSLKTVVDSLSTLITVDNQAIVKRSVPELLPMVQLLDYFGFVNNQTVELGLKDLTGKTTTRIIRPAEMNRTNRKMYIPDSLALCYKNERVYFTDTWLPDDKVYYLQYNTCWSKELELQKGNEKNAEKLPSFKAFEDKVFQTLKTAPVDKIVFDLRFNQGGNSSQGTEFIEKLGKYLKERPDVRVYVILGRFTFSSAILNAMDFKRLPRVTFVGEETSGKPNHFGEVENFQLPVSGIRVDYSTKYFKRMDENIQTLTPDIKLEPGFTDFGRGVDPAYEWVRRQ